MIDEGYLDRCSVAELAEALGIGPRHLLRLFLRHAGATPSEVAATRRVQKAKRLIDETTMTLAEVAFAAGFGSIRRFNDAFLSTYKRSPSFFRRHAHDESRESPPQKPIASACVLRLTLAAGAEPQS